MKVDPDNTSSKITVVVEGWLEKRGLWNPAWRSRYFVLDSRGRLSYFKTEADKAVPSHAHGSIPICGKTTITSPAPSCGGVPHSAQDERGADAECRVEFELRVPDGHDRAGRTFVLSAPTVGEVRRWTDALAEVQRRVLYVSFPGDVRHW